MKVVWEGPEYEMVLSRIPDEIKERFILKKKTELVSNNPKKIKYKKEYAAEGYNMLENLLFVRYYIMRKYDVQFRLIELLCNLYPRQYFTKADYYIIPKAKIFRSIAWLIKHKYVSRVVSGDKDFTSTIYTLSPKSKKIVKLLYQLLSGEKSIPEGIYENPLARKDAIWIDKARMNFIKAVNKKPVCEIKKASYQ